MPTGYTAGILDDKITTLSEFVLICSRAFGATIHMREDSLDKEYIPREVDNYYLKNIKESNIRLEEFKKLTDNEILKEEINNLKQRKEYLQNKIKEIDSNKAKLEKFLVKVESWKLPSEDYKNFKDFMIEQLNSTISFDGNSSYYKQELLNLKKKSIKYTDIENIKKEKLEYLEKDIKYAKNYYEEQVEYVNTCNIWMQQLIDSLKED